MHKVILILLLFSYVLNSDSSTKTSTDSQTNEENINEASLISTKQANNISESSQMRPYSCNDTQNVDQNQRTPSIPNTSVSVSRLERLKFLLT